MVCTAGLHETDAASGTSLHAVSGAALVVNVFYRLLDYVRMCICHVSVCHSRAVEVSWAYFPYHTVFD